MKNIIVVFFLFCFCFTHASCGKSESEIPSPEPKPEEPALSDIQYVKMKEGDIYIGARYSESQDILIWFKKCMYNELMTFYRVGLAKNEAEKPSENPDREVTVNLNTTTSDNIGPVLIEGSSWIGGNHSYLEQGEIKTASNISYMFYADGKLLKDGDEMEAKKVEVKVKNVLYDPLQPTLDDGGKAISLDVELIEENVLYTIEKGNIHVEASHTYKNTEKRIVERYYGMQSMFTDETEIMTPAGKYSDFEKAPSEAVLYKSQAPAFTRFIEKNAVNNTYQSTYLLPYYGLGTHDRIGNDDRIYIRAYGKSYHNLIASRSMTRGETVKWSGLYTWFSPYQNDDMILIYTGFMNSKAYVFIDCKKEFNKIVQLPSFLSLQKYEIMQLDENVTIEVKDSGLRISSKGKGSAILAF